MGSKEEQMVILFQSLHIILTLHINVTLFMSPESTSGSELSLSLLFSQAQEGASLTFCF